ncbi:MAG: glycosyltransferase [Verrucomicrobia bacterium]|nr:glycosyltransferase [Verrucomicrobiota bacterium]
MRISVFGLTLSSTWGNGHATLWRGLGSALARRGHQLTFFEKDVPYYAQNRDLELWADGQLVLYPDWGEIEELARDYLRDADVAIVTSFCPDAVAATDLLCRQFHGQRVFYDLDTPVTLSEYRRKGSVNYLPTDGLRRFDLVLSFTGGRALLDLGELLGGRDVRTLYGHVDPSVHHPVSLSPNYACSLSYLGTYSEDRQPSLKALLVEPAKKMPAARFLIGGALYPEGFPWTENIYFVRHLPPSEHPAFFSSGDFTLNITRPSMAEMGYCPSGRLFEAAACGATILTDRWEGLEIFFEPGREIVVTTSTAEVLTALQLSQKERRSIGAAARARVLAQHTSEHRAIELERLLHRP